MPFLSPTSANDIHWNSSFLQPPTDSWGKGRRILLHLLSDISTILHKDIYIRLYGLNLYPLTLADDNTLRYVVITYLLLVTVRKNFMRPFITYLHLEGIMGSGSHQFLRVEYRLLHFLRPSSPKCCLLILKRYSIIY